MNDQLGKEEIIKMEPTKKRPRGAPKGNKNAAKKNPKNIKLDMVKISEQEFKIYKLKASSKQMTFAGWVRLKLKS